ncbi:hypothetical protein [Nesterenkonia pannonica]|uniref:hypothetical protein n=1 Tax=Nesterenkonia pannonica TaxID=1548602 RepID=UPI002164C768|nr:hypothetical protein [Nesterenkonia pannonica]
MRPVNLFRPRLPTTATSAELLSFTSAAAGSLFTARMVTSTQASWACAAYDSSTLLVAVAIVSRNWSTSGT